MLINRYVCEVCGEDFMVEDDCIDHILEYHTKEELAFNLIDRREFEVDKKQFQMRI